MLVVGDREAESGAVSVRHRKHGIWGQSRWSSLWKRSQPVSGYEERYGVRSSR